MPQPLAQATVFTEATTYIPADIVAPLRPHIAGGEAALHRYSVAAEKADISVGAYNPIGDETYDYPDKSDTGIVDLDYVSVHIDNALLQYWTKTIGTGSAIAPVGGYKNRIAYAGANGFKTNTASYPRLTNLYDRDVQVGDVLFLTDGTHSLTTSVAGLVPDAIAGVIGSATSDSGNALAQPSSHPGSAPTVNPTGGGASGGLLDANTFYARYSFVGPFGETAASPASSQFTCGAGDKPQVTIPALPTGATSANIYLSPPGGTAVQCTLYLTGVVTTTPVLLTAYVTGAAYPPEIAQISGTVNDVNASAISVSSYDGLATGDITDTYTIEVTTLGAPGTALLSITSASGRDNVTSITPAAYNSPTTIGTRGVTVTFAHTSNDFVVGQTWQATVRQAWALATPTSGGAFTGNSTINYIVKVTRGGLYTDSTKPQITVTSDTGIDTSGPTTVTAATTNFAAGTLGVLIQFAGTGLDDGDIYHIPVTGPTTGAYKTIITNDNLNAGLLGDSDMTATLYIKDNITVPSPNVANPPTLFWSAGASNITVNSGIQAGDATLTNNGAPFLVPVMGGTVYINYREWIDAHAGSIYSAVDQATAEAALGLTFANISPDHVMPYSVMQAVKNCNGRVVYFSGVADPSNLTQWQDVTAMLAGYNDKFSLVPLSRNPDVISAYQTHVTTRSDDSIGGEWRHAWFNLQAVSDTTIVSQANSSDAGVVLGTLADDPSTSGTQYTLLTCTSSNGKFVTNSVQPGDVVRYLYTVDGFGNTIYSSFTVDHVVNEDTLVLTTGNSVAVSTPQKVEIHRTLTKDQVATNLAGQLAGAYLNKRFKYVWPDSFTDDLGNTGVDGFHLCSIYAAMVGGVAPQQGLRNVTVGAVTDVPRSTVFFNNGQLNTLAAAGFVILTKDTSGNVFTLFARTPDATSTDSFEEATTRLDDAIRYLLWDAALEDRGNTNLTGAALAKIRTEVQSAIGRGVGNTNVDRIGPMMSSGTIDDLRPHATLLDKLVLSVSVVRPFPLNDAEVTITF